MNSELLNEREGQVVTLTLNRPERRHALSFSLLKELEQTLEVLAGDYDARVIIIASSGKVFSSGHDLGEMRERDVEEYHRLFETCSRVMQQIRRMPQPVIARVQGLATAAGCQLVAACDLAVACEEAQFATPGVKIGLFCTTPMVPLVRNVSPKFAMEMLLTGQPVSAQRALQAGLVNAVVPAGKLDETIQGYVDAILASSGTIIALGKHEFYDQLHLDEPSAYARSVDVMTENAVNQDAQEGIRAFFEKRQPKWSTSKGE